MSRMQVCCGTCKYWDYGDCCVWRKKHKAEDPACKNWKMELEEDRSDVYIPDNGD